MKQAEICEFCFNLVPLRMIERYETFRVCKNCIEKTHYKCECGRWHEKGDPCDEHLYT